MARLSFPCGKCPAHECNECIEVDNKCTTYRAWRAENTGVKQMEEGKKTDFLGGRVNPAEPQDISSIIKRHAEAINKEAAAKLLKPKRVIYHDPATIIIWNDGSKTIVKCSPDTEYDAYAGFCSAVAKKLYGSSNAVRKAAGLPRGEQWQPSDECDICENNGAYVFAEYSKQTDVDAFYEFEIEMEFCPKCGRRLKP